MPGFRDQGRADDHEVPGGEGLVEPVGRVHLVHVRRLDVLKLLRNHVGFPAANEVEQLVPREIEIPSGRRVTVDYSGEQPTIAARVQEFFGSASAPRIAGRPVLLMLLSPADRPVQITADLEGFWDGSWREVRKDMAGRYPKHRWPEDPRAEEPGRR